VVLTLHNKGIEHGRVPVHYDLGTCVKFEQDIHDICLIVDIENRHSNMIRGQTIRSWKRFPANV
jgi:hypothetical protein